MKSITAALAAHLLLPSTSLCTLWKVTRADGAVFAFTDHDKSVVYPAGSPTGITYVATDGYTRSAVQTTAALNVDNLDIQGGFSATAMTEADLRAGLWDYASVEIMVVNWADLTMDAVQLRKGRLGEVKTGRTAFTLELRGMLQNIQQDIGRLYGPACDADLGDARCGVVLGGSPNVYTFVGTLTSVDSNRVFYDAAMVNASGFFDYGKITFITGLNAGLSMEVKTFLQVSPGGGQITTQLPLPYTAAIGDTYSMHAGCDKLRATCFSKFNNVVNFRGFPDVPGMDQIMSGGL